MKKSKTGVELAREEGIIECIQITFYVAMVVYSSFLIFDLFTFNKKWWFYIVFGVIALILLVLSWFSITPIDDWITEKKFYKYASTEVKIFFEFVLAVLYGFAYTLLGVYCLIQIFWSGDENSETQLEY